MRFKKMESEAALQAEEDYVSVHKHVHPGNIRRFLGRGVEREPKTKFFFAYNLRLERGTVLILISLSAQSQYL